MSEFWPRERVVEMDNRALAHLIRCHPGKTPPDLKAVLCPKIEVAAKAPDANDEFAGLLARLVEQEPRPTRWTRKMIMKMCAATFNVSPLEIMSRRMANCVANPRQLAMYLCWKFTSSSYPDIGRTFNRDHTTILHAVRKIKKLIEENNFDGGDDPETWARLFAIHWGVRA